MGEEGALYTCLCLWLHPGKRFDRTQLHTQVSAQPCSGHGPGVCFHSGLPTWWDKPRA